MTEAEWQVAVRPYQILEYVVKSGKVTGRKSRLFGVACCRSEWHLLTDERSRRAVEMAERYADGDVKSKDLEAASNEAFVVGSDLNHIRHGREFGAADPLNHPCSVAWAAWTITLELIEQDDVIKQVMSSMLGLAGHDSKSPLYRTMLSYFTALLRCLFSLRTVSINPAWLTSDVLALATGIYEERAFDRMPILADALMDAGCENAEILDHCRGPGPHVRGCWVIDLLLGKE